jgi:hypothetical protein
MIARMLERKLPVKLRVNVQAKFLDQDRNSYNVLCRIAGHRSRSEGSGRHARRATSTHGTPPRARPTTPTAWRPSWKPSGF